MKATRHQIPARFTGTVAEFMAELNATRRIPKRFVGTVGEFLAYLKTC